MNKDQKLIELMIQTKLEDLCVVICKVKEDETWDWSEYLVEHINDEPEWTVFRIENLEENEHHDQENPPNEDDNDFPNNDDDGYDSPLTNSPTHSETTSRTLYKIVSKAIPKLHPTL
ncbi:hypothetical protein Tco_0684162 [Tanacetum coccineum]